MNTAIGVCGFGRCGTSMLMEMLAAGGIEPAGNTAPRSHELLLGGEGLQDVVPRLAATGDLDGHTVKLLDYALRWPIPTGPNWSFVWLDRDHVEQARSTMKLLGSLGALDPFPVDGTELQQRHHQWHLADQFRSFVRSYGHDRPKALGALRKLGPVVVLQYEQVLANPLRAIRHLRRIAPHIDGVAAASVVHRRDGRCRPTLDFETTGAVA